MDPKEQFFRAMVMLGFWITLNAMGSHLLSIPFGILWVLYLASIYYKPPQP